MEKRILQKLAESMTSEIGSVLVSQYTKILGLLEEGRPVSVGEVANELGASSLEAKALLTKFGGEFNGEGNLVGLGLTQVRTPHRFEVEGHKLYAWCATDTLLFPMLLNKSAKVETVDPLTGDKIRLTITPNGVEKVEPSGAVLSWSSYLDATDVRGTFCNVGHWFASRQSANTYASKHKGVLILAAGEVREILKIVAQRAQVVA